MRACVNHRFREARWYDPQNLDYEICGECRWRIIHNTKEAQRKGMGKYYKKLFSEKRKAIPVKFEESVYDAIKGYAAEHRTTAAKVIRAGVDLLLKPEKKDKPVNRELIEKIRKSFN